MSKRTLSPLILLAGALLFPVTLGAQQQMIAASAAPAALPDAPSPQDPGAYSSSLQPASFDLERQNPAPTAPQTPAQATTPTPAQTDGQTDNRSASQKALDQEEHQRMLGVIPNFNTVISGVAPPIDARQKFQLFFKSSVDPFQFVAAGVDSGIEQAEDSYPEYGEGVKGYAKRYGASFADSFDGNFFGNALLPAVFHQDPRYFRLGHGSFMHRFWYSISTTVRAKGDDGHWQFNYTNIAGNFIGGAISNAYYPSADRGFGLTIERGATITAEGAIGSLAVEFYPDVIQYYRNRRARKAAAAGIERP